MQVGLLLFIFSILSLFCLFQHMAIVSLISTSFHWLGNSRTVECLVSLQPNTFDMQNRTGKNGKFEVKKLWQDSLQSSMHRQKVMAIYHPKMVQTEKLSCSIYTYLDITDFVLIC
mmetsp:Transcript_8913/g.16178  ORF Transcript_8913/g.16178 Transcript_8913/m.16178 type:complete len:115 (-) Transcript_8913:1067-1411(-)